ncbi:unnamed protein product, partial [Heterosigma akashiwo]
FISSVRATLGFSLNEIQSRMLEEYNGYDDNILLLSPTGTGKTLAYLIPIVKFLFNGQQSSPDQISRQVLVIAPTRELSLQIEQVFKSMKTSLKSTCCYGGHSVSMETRSLINDPPSLIVGTPGRVLDHFRRGSIDGSNILICCYDEFDKSLEFGFTEEMAQIVEYCPNISSRVLVSATNTLDVPRFVGATNLKKLDFITGPAAGGKLTVKKVVCKETDKLLALVALLGSVPSRGHALVFVNHREAAARVALGLRGHGVACAEFHGGLDQGRREEALCRLRQGSLRVLVATDLGGRGLDVPAVAAVVHYQLPRDAAAWAHRNGRTARAGAAGAAFALEHPAPPFDAAWVARRARAYVSNAGAAPSLLARPEWATLILDKGKRDKVGKGDVVGFFCQIGLLDRDDLGLIEIKDKQAWVAVKQSKVRGVLKLTKGQKIKRQKVRVIVPK